MSSNRCKQKPRKGVLVNSRKKQAVKNKTLTIAKEKKVPIRPVFKNDQKNSTLTWHANIDSCICGSYAEALRAEKSQAESRSTSLSQHSLTAGTNLNACIGGSIGVPRTAQHLSMDIANLHSCTMNSAANAQSESLKAEALNVTWTSTAHESTTAVSNLYSYTCKNYTEAMQSEVLEGVGHNLTGANKAQESKTSYPFESYAEILCTAAQKKEEDGKPNLSRRARKKNMPTAAADTILVGRKSSSEFQSSTPQASLPAGGTGLFIAKSNRNIWDNAIGALDSDEAAEEDKLKQMKRRLQVRLSPVTSAPDPFTPRDFGVEMNRMTPSYFSFGDKISVGFNHSLNVEGKDEKKLRRIHFALSVLNNSNKFEVRQFIQQGVADAHQRRKQAVLSSLCCGCEKVSELLRPPTPSVSDASVPRTCTVWPRCGVCKACLYEASAIINSTQNVGKCSDQENKSTQVTKTFPQKLMEILSREDTQHAITWLPEGDVFSIVDRSAFLSEVAPKFFTEFTNLQGFLRRLDRWGFKKASSHAHLTRIQEEDLVYWHKFFSRSKPELCAQIRTTREDYAPGDDGKDPPIPRVEPKKGHSRKTISHEIGLQWAKLDKIYR